jgi:hypothetical protein
MGVIAFLESLAEGKDKEASTKPVAAIPIASSFKHIRR